MAASRLTHLFVGDRCKTAAMVDLWSDGGPSLGMHQYFAGEHLGAARLMAERAREREDYCLSRGELGVDWDLRAYTLAAISESVAFLEAAVNEFLGQVLSFSDGDPRLAGIPPGTVESLQAKGAADKPTIDKMPILDKYDVTLESAERSKLNRGARPCQDVAALIAARNALVHYKTEMQWSAVEHAIEKRLKHLVPKNPMFPPDAVPWFPHHLLSAGVAEWAWQVSLAMYQQWRGALNMVVDATRTPSRWVEPQRGGDEGPTIHRVSRQRLLVLPEDGGWLS